jgi:hypothetical protein
MVEIHEPIRLVVVVEAEPALAAAILERNPSLARLVTNRWLLLSTLSPSSATLHLWDARRGGFVVHRPELHELPVVGSSLDWYGGRREHLRCARIVPGRRYTRLEGS